MRARERKNRKKRKENKKNLMLGTYSKFARENNFLALGVYCPGTTKHVPHMSNRN